MKQITHELIYRQSIQFSDILRQQLQINHISEVFPRNYNSIHALIRMLCIQVYDILR